MPRSGNPNPVIQVETQFKEGNTAGEATQFSEGNEAAIKHGVRRAIEDLAAGRPLRGDLATIQHNFREQIATHEGRLDAQQDLAASLLAVAQGLLAVVQGALAEGNKAKAASYAVHFGNLANKALVAVKTLDEMLEEKGTGDILDAAIRAAKGDK